MLGMEHFAVLLSLCDEHITKIGILNWDIFSESFILPKQELVVLGFLVD